MPSSITPDGAQDDAQDGANPVPVFIVQDSASNVYYPGILAFGIPDDSITIEVEESGTIHLGVYAVNNGLPADPTHYPVEMGIKRQGDAADYQWYPATWDTLPRDLAGYVLLAMPSWVANNRGSYLVAARITDANGVTVISGNGTIQVV